MAKPEKRKSSKTSSKKTSPKKRSSSKQAAKAPAKSQGKARGIESMSYVLITLVVLVLANVVMHVVPPLRFDLTANRLYSLSDGSRNLVGDLEDDMEVTAYFTAELPAEFAATEIYVRNILAEYEAASGGNLHVRFVNPDDDEEREAAERDGIQEVPHQLIRNDSVSVMNGYRGLVIRYLGERQTIPVIQDTRGLEYAITQKIRLLVREPYPIGIVEGHGSPSPTEGLASLTAALPHYELRTVNVAEEIDSSIRALLIVNPTEELTEPELRRIDQYVMNGGSLGVFGGSMNISLEGGVNGNPVNTGVNRLLERWGVEVGSGVVADARCGRVPWRSPIGIPIPVAFPPAPTVLFDDEAQEHPVLFRLPQATFFFPSPITVSDAFHRLDGRVLARSSEDGPSWLMTGDTISLQPRDPREWRPTAAGGPHIVMVSLEGTLPSAFAGGESTAEGSEGSNIEAPAESTGEVRVLVAGTGSLLRDEFLPNPQQGQRGAGVALALNAVDWLAQDSDLIAIRAKNIEDPALDVPQAVTAARDEAIEAAEAQDEEGMSEAIERHSEAQDAWESRKLNYKIAGTLGPALLVIIFGGIRWKLRGSKRQNLEELRKKLTSKKTKRAR